MIEIGIVGARNSGKTSLVEALLPLIISRGFKVATIKHTKHEHTFDTEGKDSYRHRQAGASMTLAVSNVATAVFTDSSELSRRSALELLAGHCDLCLVEGDKTGTRPKILMTHNSESLPSEPIDQVVCSYGSDSFRPDVPHFTREQASELADFVINNLLNGDAADG